MDCSRTIIRHIGPPGPGVPNGGTTGQLLVKASDADQDTEWSSSGAGLGDVVGPATATNNHLAAFDGTTGNLLKDGGIPLSEVFTVTLAENKVDKVAGKGLSTNDYTDSDKAKVTAATAENFRGEYATFLALTTALPSGEPGDYANVVSLGTDAVQYVWDDTNEVWFSVNGALEFDGQDLADLIFNPTDAAAYSQADTRIFTTSEKTALAGAASLTYVNSLALAAGILEPAYASINYFDTTGVAVAITSISDGSSNLVVAAPVTTLDPDSALFDSPSPGRLRFTGTSSRRFVASFVVSFTGPASSDIVVTLAKNGSAIVSSKLIVGTDATPTTVSASTDTQISLTTNDYLEVYFGNLTNTNDPTVKKLAIEISPA